MKLIKHILVASIVLVAWEI